MAEKENIGTFINGENQLFIEKIVTERKYVSQKWEEVITGLEAFLVNLIKSYQLPEIDPKAVINDPLYQQTLKIYEEAIEHGTYQQFTAYCTVPVRSVAINIKIDKDET